MTIPINPTPDQEWTNDATGITYVWDGTRWSVKPGESPDYVLESVFEADQQRQDTANDEFKAESRAADAELEGNIDRIDGEQSVQNNQINSLETQIQLLAKASGGVWRYERNISGTSPRPPGTSRFYGTHTDGVDTVLTSWSDLRLLMVNKSDVNGTDFVFTNFEVGDRVEIIATDGSSLCIGTIETAATQDNYGNMIVSPDRTNGGPEESKEYLISVFRPGEEGGSNIDIDVLDQRYATIQYSDEGDEAVTDYANSKFLPLTGGTLTGTLTGMLIKSVRETGYAVEVKPGNTGDASAFIHTNGDVKAKKIKIESDLANGSDRPFELLGRLSDGTTVSKDFFYMYANADGTASAMNYDGKMNSDKNLVNKKYVTDKDNNKVPGRFTYESGALYYNT